MRAAIRPLHPPTLTMAFRWTGQVDQGAGGGSGALQMCEELLKFNKMQMRSLWNRHMQFKTCTDMCSPSLPPHMNPMTSPKATPALPALAGIVAAPLGTLMSCPRLVPTRLVSSHTKAANDNEHSMNYAAYPAQDQERMHWSGCPPKQIAVMANTCTQLRVPNIFF